uniref:DNA-directed DNA polymerase n=2 Tax=Meloidogyne TaxID=189290 RepID=A0A914LXX5_MELIC
MIKDVPADAESLLSGIFQFCVDQAMEHAREKNIEPQQLACTLTSDFLDYDIWVPFSNLSNNTVDAMLNRCQHIAQSKKQDELSLFGAPFSITVTTINKNSFNKRRRLGGAARKIPKTYRLMPSLYFQVLHYGTCKRKNIEPQQLACTLTSDFLDYDIWVPFSNLSNNTVDAMLNRCQHIAQSKKQDELSLFGAPFSITVTTINKNSFNKRRRLGGAARKIPKVRHQINNKSLIKFNNPDNMNHCLFFALIASLTQNICSWPCLKFFYYMNNLKGMAGRFQKDTYEIMNQIGAQIGLNEYDADEWIPRIVDLGIMLNDCYEQHLHNGFCKNSKKCKKCGVIWSVYDNTRLMPMSLASLVPSFDLNVEEKPFFPHMANRPENYGKEIYPTKNDYLVNGMMPEKRKMFEIWYEQHKNTPFLLDEALASYCTNDVEILMAALIAFRKEFFEVTKRYNVEMATSTKQHGGIDVLREAMTIASACMRHFRTNHLKEQHLALVPERGYDKVDGTQSLLALGFFKWYSEKFGITVQNVNSDGGEKKIGNYQLDGWVVEIYGIEVNGCVWHGCPKCFLNDNDVMPNGKTAAYLREHDKNRMEFILSQIARVDIYWECEIYQMLAKDREMRKMFYSYIDDGPIDIKSCFYGGRTGPLKLHHKIKDGERISYYDVTSLYPFINVTTSYPVGHPKVHIINKNVNGQELLTTQPSNFESFCNSPT